MSHGLPPEGPVPHAGSPVAVICEHCSTCSCLAEIEVLRGRFDALEQLVEKSHGPTIKEHGADIATLKDGLHEVRRELAYMRGDLRNIGDSVSRIENWATKDRLSTEALVRLLSRVERVLPPDPDPTPDARGRG